MKNIKMMRNVSEEFNTIIWSNFKSGIVHSIKDNVHIGAWYKPKEDMLRIIENNLSVNISRTIYVSLASHL